MWQQLLPLLALLALAYTLSPPLVGGGGVREPTHRSPHPLPLHPCPFPSCDPPTSPTRLLRAPPQPTQSLSLRFPPPPPSPPLPLPLSSSNPKESHPQCDAQGECSVATLVQQYAQQNTIVVTFGNTRQKAFTQNWVYHLQRAGVGGLLVGMMNADSHDPKYQAFASKLRRKVRLLPLPPL